MSQEGSKYASVDDLKKRILDTTLYHLAEDSIIYFLINHMPLLMI